MEGALSWLQTGFDVALAGILLGFAAALLITPDLFLSIVLFILFGLLMAITWARLDAVDIALAEAAIGAGLTGALFLNARGHLERIRRRRDGASAEEPPGRAFTRRPGTHVAGAVAGAWLLGVSVWALTHVPWELTGMRAWAMDALEPSGVDNPVTAVLLSFRAYDTLLEIAVILLAVVGAWSQRLRRVPGTSVPTQPPGRILVGNARILGPLAVLSGGYLLWRGTHAPGGAFQGGAVLAGAGVLLLLAERRPPPWVGRWPGRLLLASGVLVFVGAGLAGAAMDGVLLAYRGDVAARWIVIIELAATVTIAGGLVALFSGRPPGRTEAP